MNQSADHRVMVAISGASSFTGCWIAATLSKHFKVHALFSQSEDSYEGLRAERINWIPTMVEKHFGVKAENGTMAQWIQLNRPNVWIHHHHHMKEFRTPGYDVQLARSIGIVPLGEITESLSSAKCRLIIQSGSYFEQGKSGSQNPYARSKMEVAARLAELASQRGIPFARVIIPNPVGPREGSDRFIPIFYDAQKNKTPFRITAPDSVLDNLPVQTLAETYLQATQEGLKGNLKQWSPSGRVSTLLDWAQYVGESLGTRLGLQPPNIKVDPTTTVAARHENIDKTEINWTKFWNDYASHLSSIDGGAK